jgi:hypothetical protein
MTKNNKRVLAKFTRKKPYSVEELENTPWSEPDWKALAECFHRVSIAALQQLLQKRKFPKGMGETKRKV